MHNFQGSYRIQKKVKRPVKNYIKRKSNKVSQAKLHLKKGGKIVKTQKINKLFILREKLKSATKKIVKMLKINKQIIFKGTRLDQRDNVCLGK